MYYQKIESQMNDSKNVEDDLLSVIYIFKSN